MGTLAYSLPPTGCRGRWVPSRGGDGRGTCQPLPQPLSIARGLREARAPSTLGAPRLPGCRLDWAAPPRAGATRPQTAGGVSDMPRKAAAKPPSGGSTAVIESTPAPSYVPPPAAPAAFDLLNEPVVADTLTDEQREQLGLAAIRELDDIATVQAVTRDASGKLADAYLVAQVLALRLYGHSPAASAEIMGVPESRVTTLLQRVRRDADIDTQMRRLDDIAVPLAVDNIIRGVVQGDKEYTLEFARGRGLFKTHQSVKQETQITEVKISIEAKMPAHLVGQPLPTMKAGAVVAAPATAAEERDVIDAETIDG